MALTHLAIVHEELVSGANLDAAIPITHRSTVRVSVRFRVRVRVRVRARVRARIRVS